ncbi:hypothetical protein M0812_22206 [Anaeramoeba flamelloides]|uniref:Uncharacterized protein n=1 Tax=Anaeramoeba flamelloides TaxID=1746091 RepID=A0AAV7YWT8_9EUKA|nr:hypothetical protein M0812_22206 [Anaeramoeba flamelloides]
MGNQNNNTNTHHIKRRHKKKYFQKLETIDLHIAVYSVSNLSLVYLNKIALKNFGLEKIPQDQKLQNHKFSPAYQKFFKCSTMEALQKVRDQVKNSNDGTVQFGWDCKTLQGEPFSIWITSTKIQIGKELYAQCIGQKIKDEEEQPELIDQSLVKVKISDNSSELTTTVDMSETTTVQENKQQQGNSTSVGIISSLEEFNKEDFTESIIDGIKKKIRTYDDFETESFITNQLNLLNKKIDEQKNYYQQKISEILQSSSKQKSDQKQKYLELETLYGKRLNSFKKEKQANKELKEEVKDLKKRISKIKKQLNDL